MAPKRRSSPSSLPEPRLPPPSAGPSIIVNHEPVDGHPSKHRRLVSLKNSVVDVLRSANEAGVDQFTFNEATCRIKEADLHAVLRTIDVAQTPSRPAPGITGTTGQLFPCVYVTQGCKSTFSKIRDLEKCKKRFRSFNETHDPCQANCQNISCDQHQGSHVPSPNCRTPERLPIETKWLARWIEAQGDIAPPEWVWPTFSSAAPSTTAVGGTVETVAEDFIEHLRRKDCIAAARVLVREFRKAVKIWSLHWNHQVSDPAPEHGDLSISRFDARLAEYDRLLSEAIPGVGPQVQPSLHSHESSGTVTVESPFPPIEQSSPFSQKRSLQPVYVPMVVHQARHQDLQSPPATHDPLFAHNQQFGYNETVADAPPQCPCSARVPVHGGAVIDELSHVPTRPSSPAPQQLFQHMAFVSGFEASTPPIDYASPQSPNAADNLDLIGAQFVHDAFWNPTVDTTTTNDMIHESGNAPHTDAHDTEAR